MHNVLSCIFRFDLGFSVLKDLAKRFENSTDIGRIYIAHVEHLLSSKKSDEARALLSDVIASHRSVQPLPLNVKKRFHLLFWEQAGKSFEV